MYVQTQKNECESNKQSNIYDCGQMEDGKRNNIFHHCIRYEFHQGKSASKACVLIVSAM